MMNRRHREDVLVRRHVTVETIPSGHPVELEPGQFHFIFLNPKDSGYAPPNEG